MQANKKPIVVVGSVNLDFVSRPSRLPLPGETIFSNSFETHPGGKGANQAVAVARLGYPVRMIGRVGSDQFGDHLLDCLVKAGVDVGCVLFTRGPSGSAVILLTDSGENSIIVTPGANAFLSADDIRANAETLRTAGMVLTQLETPIEALAELSIFCQAEGIPLILDPALAKPIPEAILRAVTWFTPNQVEASFFQESTGAEEDAEHLINNLMSSGVAGVILKRGRHGAILRSSEGTGFEQPAFPAEVLDTTAAGDAFNGAFAVGLMEDLCPEESLTFAAAAASICVERTGAQEAMPSRTEVLERLNVSSRGIP